MANNVQAIAVVGDLQQRLSVEFFREDNTKKTAELVCQMKQEPVGATVLLGDLVAFGASKDNWKHFDELAVRLEEPLLPVRGNHDLMGSDEKANREWVSRFPWFDRQPWYAVKWNRVALIFLDSNLGELEPDAQRAEAAWYQSVLSGFEQDPSVAGVIAFLHHAPYTANPNAQGGRDTLRRVFVEPFCAHRKALAMISGHAHDYERYDSPCGEHRVEFIVSGGGGGPAPRLVTPSYNDDCFRSGHCAEHTRPMHYLVLHQDASAITVLAHALGQPRSVAFDSTRLPFVVQPQLEVSDASVTASPSVSP